jgi:hypothetical protein
LAGKKTSFLPEQAVSSILRNIITTGWLLGILEKKKREGINGYPSLPGGK